MRAICFVLLVSLTVAAAPPDRKNILLAMQEVMGPRPKPALGKPQVNVLKETPGDGFTLRRIDFDSGDGDRVPAYLLLPKNAQRRHPAMLCLHQTTALGKKEPVGFGPKQNLHYAAELARRGYVALAPDYPGYGDYKIDVYAMGYVSASMKGIRNHMRAVDVLVSLPEVDAKRIGVIGHSLGGHNSLFVAAFDRRIKAAVTSCGFTSFAKYYGGDLTGWSHPGYMPRIAGVYGKSPARMPFDFKDVLAAIAPRAVFINAPLLDANFDVSGVDDTVEAVRSLYRKTPLRLQVRHPACAHDFPPEVREDAYRFLDGVL